MGVCEDQAFPSPARWCGCSRIPWNSFLQALLTNLFPCPPPAPCRTLHSHGLEEYKKDGSGKGICKWWVLLRGGQILPSRKCRQPGFLWRKCPTSKEVICQMSWESARLYDVDMKCLENSAVCLSLWVYVLVCVMHVSCTLFRRYSLIWTHSYQSSDYMKALPSFMVPTETTIIWTLEEKSSFKLF